MSNGPDAPTTSRRDRTEGALIGLAIMVLTIPLLMVRARWAYNFQLIEYDRYLWMTVVVVFLGTIVAAEAAWHRLWRRSCTYSPLLGVFAAVAAYTVFYPIANGALDRRAAQQRAYVVERRYCSGRKREGASMWLRPVATPERGQISLRVSGQYCRETQDGEEVLLDVKPGFFGSAWVVRYEDERW